MGGQTSKTDVKGVCHPAFAPLREAFAEDFASGRSIGASVALYVRSFFEVLRSRCQIARLITCL